MPGCMPKKEKNIPIDHQILYVKRDIEKTKTKIDYISKDFAVRRYNHEVFALYCMLTVVGWALYPFEGIAFLTDLAITEGRLASQESKKRGLVDKLGDLELQKEIAEKQAASGNRNTLFCKQPPEVVGTSLDMHLAI